MDSNFTTWPVAHCLPLCATVISYITRGSTRIYLFDGQNVNNYKGRAINYHSAVTVIASAVNFTAAFPPNILAQHLSKKLIGTVFRFP